MKEYKFKIGGKEFNVVVNSINGNKADVTVNGVNYDVDMENASPVAAPVQAPATQAAPAPAAAPAPTAAPAASGSGKAIVSPLPGVIISVEVKEGAAVKKGQRVAVIEAMKMENDILSDVDGTVTAIHVSKGDTVAEDAKIVTIG
ncbi:MAG: biotin/lipoyl-containing protein [Candidatus Cryptobacteroides sp.]